MSYQFNPPLEVSDFSGGFSDNYIDARPNVGETVENYLIQKNKKLISRDGTLIYDSTAYQIPAGNQRIGSLILHPQIELFVQSARALYYINSTYQTLVGPVDSNPALSTNATTNYISSSNWKNHAYIVSDSFADPIKVYKDNTSTWRVNTAGLPSVDLEGAIDLANAIKVKYNLHIADGAQHTTGVDSAHITTAATAWDFNSLITLVTELLTDYAAHNADADLSGGRAYHPAQAPTSRALTSSTAPTDLDECLDRLDDLRTKYQAHDADGTAHAVGSSHQMTAYRTPQITAAVGAANYLYKFLYRHTYYVGNVLFEVLGSTLEVEALLLGTGTKSISQIPAISNGTTRCYDTANITCEIYRTEDSGTVFYYVGRVTNGTTTFSDTVTDAALVDNPTIYTNGGALDHDTPPPAKFIHIVNNVAVYGYVQEGAIQYPTRYRLSIPDSPDSAPASLGDDAELPLTGINSVGIYPILFCRNRTYRLEGIFDELGRGTPQLREISRTKGCISNKGIVQVPGGLVFPGVDQFYFTDGYTVNPIDIHHIESYKELVSSSSYELKISGRYDSKENRVYWCVADNTTNNDNNKMWVLDLNFKPPTDPEMPFTKIANADSWSPTDIEFFNGYFIISDTRGYLFKFDSNTFTDPEINVSTNPSTWNTNTVIWDYKSFATSFGTVTNFKFVPTVTLQAKNTTNVTIQIKSNNDDSGLFNDLKEIRVRGGITWGDPNVIWGDTSFDYLWNVNKMIRVLRRFPSGNLRMIYKQIQITNSYTIIYNSDTLSTGNISGTAKTLTLTDVSLTLPTEIVNYFVSFETDDYTEDFEITTRNSATVLTFSDPSNLVLTTTGTKWLIKGYRKGERLNLLSYSINNAMLGQNQEVYRGSTGGNS